MSFGSTGFSGFGANNNNNQQQQQQPPQNNAFGGFGSNNAPNTTGGFGSSGNIGFGAANSNTGSSLFGGNTNATSGAFGSGGFGSNNNQTSAFGAPKPFGATNTSGGSLFGNNNNNNATSNNNNNNNNANTTSSFGAGGFGSTNNTSTGFGSSGGSLFGNTSAQQSTAFGSNTSGGGLFGNTNNQSTGFGANNTNTGFGSSPSAAFANNTSAQNNGTGATPFQPFSENNGTNQNEMFQSIACMPQYRNFQFEELRNVDYNQGRQYGNQSGQPGAFGQASSIGGFGQNNNSTSGFGSTSGGSLFGNQNQNQNQSQNQSNPFGTNTASTTFANSGSLFGNKPNNPGGLFGNNNTNTTNNNAPSAQTSGGIFGASGGSGFGSQNNTGFGNNTGGGLFGQNNQQQKTSLFGATNNAGTSNFGTSNTGTGFGSTNTGGGLFGANNNQQQQPQQNTTGFGAQPNSQAGGLFGGLNQNQNNQQPQSGGLFGSSFNSTTNQQKPSLFGNNPSTSAGMFGANVQQPNQPQQPGGLFGASNTNQPAQGGGLFGSGPAQQKPSLFGATQPTLGAAGGLLGGLNQNQQGQTSSLFNQNNNQQKPSLFGGATNANSTGNSLFGGLGQTNPNNQSTQAGSLFGATNQSQQPQLGNSFFGGSSALQNAQQQQPQQLTTSIMSNNPYGNEHLFVNLGTPNQPVGPLMTPLSSAQKARKPMPLPTYRLNPQAASRLLTPKNRSGYGFDYSSYGTPASALSNASPFGRTGFGRSLGKSLSTSNLRGAYSSDESILSPGAFSSGGMRSGSGNMKKLKINRNLRTDLFGNDSSVEAFKVGSPKKTVSFDPTGNSREALTNGEHTAPSNGESSNALVRVDDPDSPTPSAEEQGYLRSSRQTSHRQTTPNGEPSQPEMEQVKGNELAVVPENDTPSSITTTASLSPEEKARSTQKDMEPGEYYMIPSRAEIQKMPRKDRAKIGPFVVGRERTGRIEFDQVDLSNTDLDKIMGDIVQITPRSATVYPNHSNKPTVGHGMNFPARITLENSWPRARGGKVPVFERKGPRFEKHLERLRRVTGTEFEQYIPDKGQWIFRVPHFSTYALDYSDEDDSAFGSPAGSAFLPPHLQDSPLDHQGPLDDTFEFRTSKSLPGAFDGNFVAREDTEIDQGEDYYDDGDDDDGFANSQTNQAQDPTYIPRAEDDIFDINSQLDGIIDDDSPRNHVKSLISPMKPKSILKTSRQPIQGFGTPPPIGPNQDWASQLQRTLSPKKQNRQALRQTQASLLQDLQLTEPEPSVFDREQNPFATSIDVMNSLFGSKSVTIKSQAKEAKGFQWPYAKRNEDEEMSEADREFHKSFKPSWAFDGTFIYSAAGPTSNSAALKTRISFEGNDNEFGCFAAISPTTDGLKHATDTLYEQQAVTAIYLEDGCPRAQTSHSLSFGSLADVVNGEGLALRHERLTWRLASILFDDENASDSIDEDWMRKKALSEFWTSLVETSKNQHLTKVKVHGDDSNSESAIVHLSGHDVTNAVVALSEGKNYRLSTMIAQIGGDETIRHAFAEELGNWRKAKTLSEISLAIRALYELLSGNTCTAEGITGPGAENRAKTFNISEQFGLDWERAFGLKLWYGKLWEEDSLVDVIKAYSSDLWTKEEHVLPLPWFLRSNTETGWDDPHPEERQDILFGLLKIYALSAETKTGKYDEDFANGVKLADIISPQNVSGNPTDARLSFQLYHALSCKDIIDFPDDEKDHKADLLTTDYAFQLSSDPRNLRDAIFVTLHLSDASRREAAVRALLNRHAGAIAEDESRDVFQALTKDLKIPASWIWTAKALYAKALLVDERQECYCLLKAGKDYLQEAHNVLRQTLGPKCIIEENLPVLREVLGWFKGIGAPSMKGWDLGGGLYDDYIRFLELARHGDKNELRSLVKKLSRTLESMAGAELGLSERVAITVITTEISTLTNSTTLQLLPSVAVDSGLRRALKLSESYYKSVEVGGGERP